MNKQRFAPLALAAGLAMAVSFPTWAAPAADAAATTTAESSVQSQASERQQGPRGGQHARGDRHGGKGHHAHHARHVWKALDLTEEQKDKIFAVRHAAMPELREAMKEVRTAKRELRALAQSGDFEVAKAEELAKKFATAQAHASLSSAKMQAEVVAVLTPEQRAKAQELRSQRGEGHRGGRSNRAEGSQMP